MIATRSIVLLVASITLLLVAACDTGQAQAPETLEEIEAKAELFRGLAEAAAESEEPAKAGGLFVVAAMFQKDVQKALWRQAVEAQDRGDDEGFKQAMTAAGRAARRAADTMTDAANAFEQAGSLEDAWRTHFEAAKCYVAAGGDFLIAGDKVAQLAVLRDAANARAQGARIQRQLLGNP